MPKRFYPEHLKRRRRKLIIIVASLVLLIVFGGGLWLYKRESDKPSWEKYTNESLGVRLQYPSTFAKTSIDEENKNAGVVLRLEKVKPKALFSLRSESGLGPLKLAGGSIFDALVTSVNRQYPERFPEYKKENYREITVGSEKAALFEFTYIGADNKTRMKQRFVITVRDGTAYYLSAQAPESEFFKSEKDFDRIISSFEFLD